MKKYIAICDDEKMIRDDIEFIVRDLGYEPIHLENGYQAVDFVKNNVKALDTEIIIMDIKMPVMQGDAAIAEIRGSDMALKDIPIILLSAYENNDIWNKVVGKVVYYLRKPYDPELLEYFIKEVQKGNSPYLNELSIELENERHKERLFAQLYDQGRLEHVSQDRLYILSGGHRGTKPANWDQLSALSANGYF